MPDPTRETVTRAVRARLSAAEIARRFAEAGSPWFWFDGAGAAPGEARVSTLGIAGEVRLAAPGGERAFLDAMRRATGNRAHAEDRMPGPHRGFDGGWVVALSYEFGVALLESAMASDAEPGTPASPAAAADPPAVALRCDVVVAVDHDSGAVELRGPSTAAVDAWLAEHGAHLRVRERGAGMRARASDPESAPAQWRSSDAVYAAAVERCRDAIREGDAYVLCLTDTVEAAGVFDAIEVYRRLGASGAPVRGGIIDAGSHVIVSASPERFLSVRGATVSTHPIKGTRRRGRSPSSDRVLAAALAADPKERAENLMIVDLMRNDLSRVCAPGSVRVDRFLDVETHAHVHQLVSTVSGTLAGGQGIWHVIAAAFPGGSMTGAPKLRAVQLLQRLEGGPRGFYSGCFGWIDRRGDAELAMTIRSVEMRRGDRPAVAVGAGGGITIDSVAADEVAEKHLKAAALLDALVPLVPNPAP